MPSSRSEPYSQLEGSCLLSTTVVGVLSEKRKELRRKERGDLGGWSSCFAHCHFASFLPLNALELFDHYNGSYLSEPDYMSILTIHHPLTTTTQTTTSKAI